MHGKDRDRHESALKAARAPPGGFPWPLLIYLVAAVVAIALWIAFPLPWLGPPLSDILFAVGWIAIVAAAAIAVSVVRTLMRAGIPILSSAPPAQLVTTGPFSMSRNPAHLSVMLLMLGVTMVTGILWLLVAGPAAALVVQKLVIERKERALSTQFGKRYLDYARRVRRWI